MSSQNKKKLMTLLQAWPSGVVATNNWLEERSVSRFLKRTYLKSGWLESFGVGACIKGGDRVSWEGGLYALQHYLKKSIHVGGKTALALLGSGHNVTIAENEIFLYSRLGVKLPAWFKNADWQVKIHCVASDFLPASLGLTLLRLTFPYLRVTVSAPERAFLELLYITPRLQSPEETKLIAEHLARLRPA